MIMLRVLEVFLNHAGLGLYYKNDPLTKLNSADGKHLYSVNSPTNNQLKECVDTFNDHYNQGGVRYE